MRICFVCLGNICRSPAAEALVVHLAAERGIAGLVVDSSGTSDHHAGEAPHPHTLAEADRRGVAMEHRSRPVTMADFADFELLIAVDRATQRAVQRMARTDAERARVVLVGDYASDASTVGGLDVADPWGQPAGVYAVMWDQLLDACNGLLDHLVERGELSAGDGAALNVPADLVDGLPVLGATGLSGGDIARAVRLDTADGPLFLKWHPDPPPGMFEREAVGLRALRAAGAVAVPAVVRATASGLVLEWIEPGGPPTGPTFGADLAALHRTTNPTFGALDAAPWGYLGSQPLDLTPTRSWVELFWDRRVRPLAARAVAGGRLDPAALGLIDALDVRAAELCGPREPPALVHGDLWAGNRLVDRAGRSWLIDPAAHWGHRELDLAMMQLFGGFDRAELAAYDDAFPLAAGWRDRVEWYQLPPLLVHAVLFGSSYGAAALEVLRRYARRPR